MEERVELDLREYVEFGGAAGVEDGDSTAIGDLFRQLIGLAGLFEVGAIPGLSWFAVFCGEVVALVFVCEDLAE